MVFPEAHTRVSRMAKAASQESEEVMAVETTEPETEAARRTTRRTAKSRQKIPADLQRREMNRKASRPPIM